MGVTNYSSFLFTGLMRDSTGSYIPGFHVMGAMMIAGGLWLLTLPLAEKWEKRRLDQYAVKNNADDESDNMS